MPVCTQPGCPTIVTTSGYCTTHARVRNKQRGSSTSRGYGAEHQRRRAAHLPQVRAGQATCWRCGNPIQPGEPWDLGPRDNGTYGGPEHANQCNRSAAGRKSHS